MDAGSLDGSALPFPTSHSVYPDIHCSTSAVDSAYKYRDAYTSSNQPCSSSGHKKIREDLPGVRPKPALGERHSTGASLVGR